MLTQKQLVRPMPTGDQEGFRQAVDGCREQLARSLGRRLPSCLRGVLDPEDILQETFLKAWRAFGRFVVHDRASFAGWIASILANTLRDKLKEQLRLKRRSVSKGEPLRLGIEVNDVPDTSTHTCPCALLIQRERDEALQMAVDRLKEEYAEVIRLRYLEELSVPQVSARMGRSEGAVQMLRLRALEKLREEFAKATL